jgi:hypothetical protein
LGLVFFYSFPIHDLLEGGAIFVFAQGSPLHLVAFQTLDLPPLAQFILTLVLPSGSSNAYKLPVVDFSLYLQR